MFMVSALGPNPSLISERFLVRLVSDAEYDDEFCTYPCKTPFLARALGENPNITKLQLCYPSP